MISIINKEYTHQIISCNTYKKNDNLYELWVERPNGKTLKLMEGKKEEILEFKSAIDFAIETGARIFNIEK